MIIWETLEDMKIVSRKSVWLHLALESFRHLGIFPFDVGGFKKYIEYLNLICRSNVKILLAVLPLGVPFTKKHMFSILIYDSRQLSGSVQKSSRKKTYSSANRMPYVCSSLMSFSEFRDSLNVK